MILNRRAGSLRLFSWPFVITYPEFSETIKKAFRQSCVQIVCKWKMKKEPDMRLTPLFSVSGKRGSNPRPSAWEADALPLSYSRLFYFLQLSAWDPECSGLPLSYSRIFLVLRPSTSGLLLRLLLIFVFAILCLGVRTFGTTSELCPSVDGHTRFLRTPKNK